MPEWRIRALRVGDQAALTSFRCANDGEPWTIVVEQIVTTRLYKAWGYRSMNAPELSVVVADLDNRVIGVIAYATSWAQTELGHIDVLAVDPEHRRRGVATDLKTAAMADLQRHGCPGVVSTVHEQNDPMRAVNEQFAAETAIDPDESSYRLTVIRFDPS